MFGSNVKDFRTTHEKRKAERAKLAEATGVTPRPKLSALAAEKRAAKAAKFAAKTKVK